MAGAAITTRDMTAQPLQFSKAPLVGPLTPSAGFSFDRASLAVAAVGTTEPMEPKKVRVYVPKNFRYRKIWASVDFYQNCWTSSAGVLTLATALKNTLRFYQGTHAISQIESCGIANASNGAKPVLQKSLPVVFGAEGFSYSNVQQPSSMSFFDVAGVFSTVIATWVGGQSVLVIRASSSQAIANGQVLTGEFDSLELESMPQVFDTTIDTVDGWKFQTSPPLMYNINLAVLSQNEAFTDN